MRVLGFRRAFPSICRSPPPAPPTLNITHRFSSFELSPRALVQLSELSLDSIHHSTHLPWWLVIVGTTVVLRAAVTLPLAVHQVKMIAKQELLVPRLKELQEAKLHSVVVKSRKANLSHTEANKIYQKEVWYGGR